VNHAEPRVAVIIPCFNDGSLVEEAVATVREAEPVEIVVVDDGSTDPETVERLAQLEAQGTTVVRQENSGPGPARTTGLAATRAPLVYPLDADDRLEPGALAAMADVLDAEEGVGFVWGDYVLFGDSGGRYRAPDRWLPWTLTYVNPYPISSMFRRRVLEEISGWAGKPVIGYEDWDLWLRLVGRGVEGVRIDRVVYQRRLHGDSRVLLDARRRHQQLYAELQRRNANVFKRRAELRTRERPAAWKRAVYPVLFGPRKVVPVRVEAFLQRTMMRMGTGLPG
jgi:glycosyltransferase involved in cell wall biosynthesis